MSRVWHRASTPGIVIWRWALLSCLHWKDIHVLWVRYGLKDSFLPGGRLSLSWLFWEYFSIWSIVNGSNCLVVPSEERSLPGAWLTGLPVWSVSQLWGWRQSAASHFLLQKENSVPNKNRFSLSCKHHPEYIQRKWGQNPTVVDIETEFFSK